VSAAPSIPELTTLLRILVLGAYAALVVKLCTAGLCLTYRSFTAYLIFRVARGLVLLCIPWKTSLYAKVYTATEPILWFFYIVVILELYSLALGRFKGIATLGRWVISGALIAAVTISIVSLIPDLSSPHPYPYIHLTTVIGRAVCGSLALFLLGVTVFLVLFPVPLSRNVVVHSVVYSIYFLTLTLAYFVHNVFGPQTLPVVNLVLQGVTGLTLVAWMLLLSPAGEQVVVASRRPWEAEDEERLVRHLDLINAALLRVARK